MKYLWWLLYNRTYNRPDNMRTFIAQWAHQGYLWKWYPYEKYSEISAWAWKNWQFNEVTKKWERK